MKEKRNGKIEEMLAEIRSRGGMVHVDRTMPEWVTESFLQQVLDCPDCRAAARGKGKRDH